MSPMSSARDRAADPRRAATVVSLAGTALVVAQSVLGLLWAVVLDPLAGYPGRSYVEVLADVEAAGEALAPPGLVAMSLLGPAAALAVVVAARRGSTGLTVRWVLVLDGVTLAVAVIVTHVQGFGAGMAMGDTYGYGNGLASSWSWAVTGIGAVLGVECLVLLAYVTGSLPRARNPDRSDE